MVTALSGCVMRNLGVNKAIFYLIGNAEMSWEFQIMGSEQLCFRTRKKCFAISLQHCTTVLSAETKESDSSGAKSCTQGNLTWRLHASCSLVVWLYLQDKERKTFVPWHNAESWVPRHLNKADEPAHAMPGGSAKLESGSTITAMWSHTNPKLRQCVSAWEEFSMPTHT